MALTKPQRARLDKLATYLEGLPKRYRHFGMASYMDATDNKTEAHYARKNGGVASCGTSACAAGHGPAAGVLMPPRMVRPSYDGGWIVDRNEYATYLAPEEAYGWLFSGNWDEIDNHHYGAAARIRYYLAHGVPEGFDEFDYPERKHRALYAPYRIDAKQDA